jgi:uncharacterized protein (TIGR00730 family)
MVLAHMQSVCVFLSSSPGRPADVAAIAELGARLAAAGRRLVYGGASIGLMGVLADAVLAGGGEVHGVMPESLIAREIGHASLGTLEIVPDMHARKARMFELADGFIVAPGGFGTLEEAFEILTGIQIGVHEKPIVFLDLDGFWQPLAGFLDHAVAAGVLRREIRPLFRMAPDPATALATLGVIR